MSHPRDDKKWHDVRCDDCGAGVGECCLDNGCFACIPEGSTP